MATKLKRGFLRSVRFLKQNKIFTTLVAMILVLDMLIAASVAWFAMRRDTEAAEMGMGLDIIDSSADYNAFTQTTRNY